MPAKQIGFFSLIMINIITVDNLRSLPIVATFGYGLIIFYIVAGLLLFLPNMLVTAELATTWPITGGTYIWVREAFGARVGFYCAWLQWLCAISWYPTIFSFAAALFANLINPSFAKQPVYMLASVLISFWLMTLISNSGFKISRITNAIGGLVGTLLPMLILIIIGIWQFIKHPYALNYNFLNFEISDLRLDHLSFFSPLIFSLMGIEMSAVHVRDVKQANKNFPCATFYSGFIIWLSMVLAALGIAFIIPPAKLNLISGITDAVAIFFKDCHLEFLTPIVHIMIILGSISGAGAWMIGTTRCLSACCQDNHLPRFFQNVNRQSMPSGILFLQGMIVTLLSCVYLYLPSVNNVYWFLTTLTAQFGLIYYALIFAAAIKLRYKILPNNQSYRIPGGKIGIWLVAGSALFTCLLAIIVGFIPPNQIAANAIGRYEMLLIAVIILGCLPALAVKPINITSSKFSLEGSS